MPSIRRESEIAAPAPTEGMPRRPLVSVIIPAYNAESTVAATIRSALQQTYVRREVIVVDDGSTDRTASTVATFGSRVNLVRQANAGVSAARNRGVEEARGAVVAFFDADDTWHPAKLALQVAALQRPGVGAAICDVEYVDVHGVTLGVSDYREALGTLEFGVAEALRHLQFTGSYLAARRDLVCRLGGFDEALRTAEDIDMILRLSAVERVRVVDFPLLRYRVADDSLSRAVFTRNRLRVLEKLAASPISGRLSEADLRDAFAKVHLSYGEDLLWAGRVSEARRELLAAFRTRVDVRTLNLLAKCLVPRRLVAAVRAAAGAVS